MQCGAPPAVSSNRHGSDSSCPLLCMHIGIVHWFNLLLFCRQPAHAVRSVHPKTVTPRPNAWVAARAAVRAGHVEQAAE